MVRAGPQVQEQTAPVACELYGELRVLLARAQTTQRAPSLSAAVLLRGTVFWSGACGITDTDAGAEATANTQYQIGSITKMFTATAVAQLCDEGLVDLDDPLEAHLPACAFRGVTLRRMLAHLSGLQREAPGRMWETLEAPSTEELLVRLHEIKQVHPPGVRWHYSNLAYALLGEVITRRSGLPFQRYLTERLLVPLGLVRTTWVAEEPAARGHVVSPYEDIAQRETEFDLRALAAAGGLWSTAADLCRFAAFLASPNESVLRRSSATELHTVQTMVDKGWTQAYGLGIGFQRQGECVLAGHTGGLPGFAARLAYVPDGSAGAAVLTNRDATFAASQLALDLAQWALEATKPEPAEWRPDSGAPPELAGVLGDWWMNGWKMQFRFVEGRLELRTRDMVPEGGPSIFEREGPDLYLDETCERLQIVRDERGEVHKLYWFGYPLTRRWRD